MFLRTKFALFLLAGSLCLGPLCMRSGAQEDTPQDDQAAQEAPADQAAQDQPAQEQPAVQPVVKPKPVAAQKSVANRAKTAPMIGPMQDSTPAPPPAPLTLAQKPSSPPKVFFQDGLLTIVAENSTLGDILRAVHAKTGAIVDVPGNATERVVSQLGPAPAREVLAALLNGSRFNYVILGSAANPDAVQQIVLTSKSGEGGAVASAPKRNQPQDDAQGQEEMAAEETAADDGNEGDNQPDQVAVEEPPPQQAGAQDAAVKSPEQLLRELQVQQMLAQRQAQGLQPETGAPAPNPPQAANPPQ